MSAGAFVRSKYESDEGSIHPIKVQPETLSATLGGANSPPAADTDTDISARVTGGNRELGLRARSVSVKFTATPPDGYKEDQVYRIPILTPARWDAITKSTTGTYLGVACQVVGKTPENVK